MMGYFGADISGYRVSFNPVDLPQRKWHVTYVGDGASGVILTFGATLDAALKEMSELRRCGEE